MAPAQTIEIIASKSKTLCFGAVLQLILSLMMAHITNANMQNLSDKHLISGFTMTPPMMASVVSAGSLSVDLNMIFIICWNIKKLMKRQVYITLKFRYYTLIDYFVIKLIVWTYGCFELSIITNLNTLQRKKVLAGLNFRVFTPLKIKGSYN